ncbi:GNAT family N-acetyltransferase [Caviibacterium pharyngocola]|uniref:GNAT family N-acetyltransferase n=1 Tax=Caviibacterium pharyngocola TaxID=28159 RepID=A0A2M8RVY7_9PAST|nr:GNAT family N-acetyltransferase [Caviibacterium pharyngocola]PJG83051.1 GNAT family N-acetyltransferase [Caviibacterium pharyngocola]
MQIQHQRHAGGGEFFLADEQGCKIAELTYEFVNAHTINANHTYVSDSLRGQGIADKLYRELRDFVRAEQLNVVASCSYIAKKLEREKA